MQCSSGVRLQDTSATTLPCFWCVEICPIPLRRCLQTKLRTDVSIRDVTDVALRSVLLLLLSLMFKVSWEDFSVGKDGMEKLLKTQLKSQKNTVEQLLFSHSSHGSK